MIHSEGYGEREWCMNDGQLWSKPSWAIVQMTDRNLMFYLFLIPIVGVS